MTLELTRPSKAALLTVPVYAVVVAALAGFRAHAAAAFDLIPPPPEFTLT